MGDVLGNAMFKKHTAILRRVAANGNCQLLWSDEATEQIGISLGITGAELVDGLMNCQVVGERLDGGELIWSAEVADPDGAIIRAEVVVYEFEITILILGRF